MKYATNIYKTQDKYFSLINIKKHGTPDYL